MPPGSRFAVGLLAAGLLLAGCMEPPPSFRLVGLDEARSLLREGSAALVEAYVHDAPPRPRVAGGVPWPLLADEPAVPPSLPPGPVLLLAPTQDLAYRAAAALARARDGAVFVIITDSADDRGTLYALDPQQEEIPGGRDS